jgi:hypothetical protein
MFDFQVCHAFGVYLLTHVHQEIEVVLELGQRKIHELLVSAELPLVSRALLSSDSMVTAEDPLLWSGHVDHFHLAQLTASKRTLQSQQEQ